MSKKQKSMTKRQKNRAHLAPPLTFLDKLIYFSLIILTFLTVVGAIFFIEDIQRIIAFNTPSTLAYKASSSLVFALPFLFYLELTFLILIINGLTYRIPFFGSKKINYGQYPFKKDCIPLFRAKKYNYTVNPFRKKSRKRLLFLWCVVLAVLSLLLPLSLFGRSTLSERGVVNKYNAVNISTEKYNPDEFSSLTVRARHVLGFKSGDYYVYEIIITMKDGEKYTFSNKDFYNGTKRSDDFTLDKMLEIKARFDENKITVEGRDELSALSKHLKLSTAQTEKLNLLFQ